MLKHVLPLAISTLLAFTLAGSVHAFTLTPNHIYELYSSADGSIQFIMLFTTEPVRAGMTVRAGNGSAEHSFVIPPDARPTSPITLIGTQSFAELKLITPDYVVPDGFLFPIGGSVRFGPIDTSYSELPSGDVTALWGGYDDDDGFYSYNDVAVATNASNRYLTFGPGVAGINALIEYQSASLDDYFLTALPNEIKALDSGTIPGWTRTGHSVIAWTSPFASGQTAPADLRAACRLYFPAIDGNTHFYSVSQQECTDVPALHPEVKFETDAAFFATLPDLGTGACPPDQSPVYRFWNPRGSGHRFTTQTVVRDEMLMREYIAEGYGSDNVAMCVGGHK